MIIYKEVLVSAACSTPNEATANKMKSVFDSTEPAPIGIYNL
jgi:hypothetical protein